MKLEFHPGAVTNINAKAESLVTQLQAKPGIASRTPSATFEPDLFIGANIDASTIIGSPTMQVGNPATAMFFQDDQHVVALEDAAMKDFHRLVEAVLRTKAVQLVSREFVEASIFSWLQTRHQGASSVPLVEYLQAQAEAKIKEIEIWIPIHDLILQSALTIGHVTLKPMPTALFDNIERDLANKKGMTEDLAREYIKKQRKHHQGYAAGTLVILAEEHRAVEIAYDETEKALALLTFFSGATMDPAHRSYVVPFGRQKLETTKYFVMNESRISRQSENAEDVTPPWQLSDQDVIRLRGLHLDEFANSYTRAGKTSFEHELWDAFFLYSKTALTKEPHEKLLYLLPPLEGLLLKNANEPIQKNLGERLAFVLGQTATERLAIIDCVGKLYEVRSSFMHHAQKVDDLAIMREFMILEWRFFFRMAGGAARYKTKADFINAIEHTKLSGAGLFGA